MTTNNTSLEIFQAGTHTAMSGVSLSFTESQLSAMAAAYDPTLHEAPLVVGHPRDNAPAYGWVKSLAVDGTGKLRAEPDQVDPDFAEAVNAGRFKKISASFYTPNAPANPVPGVYYLRHVGFLGAQPPAVKGLKSASFSDSEEGVIEFGGYDDTINAGLWRRLRDWIIDRFDLDEADRVISEYAVGTLEEWARKPEPGDAPDSIPSPGFSEPSPTEEDQRMAEDLAAREAAIRQQEAAFAEREAAMKAREAKAKRDDITEFADGLVQEGRLLPTHKAGLVEFMAGLDGDQVIEFGEGDGYQKVASTDWLKVFLGTLPKQVDFGEIANDDLGNGNHTVSFAAPPGYSISTAAMEIHNKALALIKSQPGTSYEAAVKTITEGNV